MPKDKSSEKIRASRRRLHPKPSSGFMSTAQISEEFGLSASFLNHLPQGTLKRYPIGASKYVFARDEFIAALKAGHLASKPRRKKNCTSKPGRPKKPVID
ncbi:MAG: hypothetical protein HQL44_09395 [Alphaproteobacteria bacterium]|nr:hypothetical protein [Alphaproteobacteria bacterium]